ncbi:FecR family protein [Chitinophaga nivalis]|uniref:FecR domain-containing protein n=1 Tax=Chitinophaga nivalis TaxID=2991709 RepID=A0ABT3IEU8_9BACT|nr:FecR domain-containing protein [Chitinophaga nivalis]MCW3467830.1 FecR domain-containing protein [Chitinophaga nivalis]MCW3482478.1 FecR domain-containing protein [Chitinophaga nivalis]
MNLYNRLKLLRDYLLGKTNEDQRSLVDDWYHSVDDTRPIGLWQEEGKRNAIKGSIQLHILEQINKHAADGKVVRLRGRLMAAACITVLVIGASWLFLANQPTTYYTITAPLGEIKQIQLPDNTQVWLKSGTTLQYSSHYGKRNRRLELMGEAFFDVQKDGSKPFIVKTGTLETKVLGTAFNIQAYTDRPSIQIWVQQGRVQVSDSTEVITELSKGKRLEWDRVSRHASIDSLDWKQALAWQQGVLLLESATFSEVASELKEIYGVALVTYNDDIRELHYDAKFFIQKTGINDIIASLAAVHRIQYKIQGKTIILY